MLFMKSFKNRWHMESGYGEVLKIAFPLILSTGSWTIQHFIDRIFLTWYSQEAIAASMPASMVSWTITSLFVGTASYINTFVAQYFGAKRFDRIGASVWQGIYLAVFTAPIIFIFYPLSDGLFQLVGHQGTVQELESIYFKMLLFGSPFAIVANAISGFFSGRGKTWVVMWINAAGMVSNIILDYFLIFGNYGFPEMGIKGAGLATVIATMITAILFFIYMIRPKMNEKFCTLKKWKFDPDLFKRLLRYGVPSGMQFFLEIIAFTIFIMIVGKIGTTELAASNIAFNINMLAFLPMFGMTLAVSALVGQRLGENRAEMAEKATWSAFHIGFSYFFVLALSYVVIPELFLLPFTLQSDPETFQPIARLAILLLRFVAIYSLFDSANMIFSGALKGAGDTGFVAIASIGLSWVLMVIPCFIGLRFLNVGINWLWFFVTLYVCGLGLVLFWRFKNGIWKSMRVIESEFVSEDDIK
jgi:MATE family multidrug resistance protein